MSISRTLVTEPKETQTRYALEQGRRRIEPLKARFPEFAPWINAELAKPLLRR